MKNKRILSVIILVFSYLLNTTQSNAQGLWTTYQTTNTGSNGLYGNYIHEIAEDTLNNIWFATSVGVSKYDGTNWIGYLPFDSLVDIRIESIAVDKANNVWAGNSGNSKGLSKFDGSTWTVFNSTNGLISNAVSDICIDDTIIWIGTNRGISKYDGTNFTDINIGDSIETEVFNFQTFQFDTIMVFQNFSITSLAVDHNNNLWAAANYYDGVNFYGTLKMYNGTVWTTYTTNDGLIDSLITSIAVDNAGDLWFGSNNGVSKYDHITWTDITTNDGLISNNVKSISVDNAGVIWFATQLGASNYDGTTWSSITTNDGLISNSMSSIFPQGNGNLWFSGGYGTSMYDGTTFEWYTTKDGLISNNIRAIEGNEKGVWFGTADGASFFDGVNWKGYTTADGLSGNYITAIEEDNIGNTWFGITNAAVTILNGVNDTILGSTTYHVSDFLEDNSGNMWFGNYTGLHKYDGNNWTFLPTDTLCSNGIKSLALDSSGNIWAGFSYGIIGKYDGSTWSMDTLGDGNINHHVTSIVVDSFGNVWSHGDDLYKFDGNNWQKFDSLSGFTNDYIFNVAIDKSNYIWVSTINGVYKYNGSNFSYYSTIDGLLDNYIDNVGVDNFNNKWFGNYGLGLSKYCESMSLEGDVSYQGNNVVSGDVYLYKSADNSVLELVSTTSIAANGHYQFPVISSGYYVVSALGNSTNYPNTIETYYHSSNNPCNNFELIMISCSDTISNINITLANTGSNISSSFTKIDNGNANYTFTNSSTGNFNKSHWAFGDGNTSTATNPTHTFSTNGIFLVVLTVKDSTIGSSCFDYYIDTINVTGVTSPLQCTSGFVMYPDTTTGDVIVVNSNTGTNLTYLWDFGDGNISTQAYPSHIYAMAGPFYLCLTVDDGAGCNDMYCDSIGENGVVFKTGGFTINVIAPPIITGINSEVKLSSEVEIYPNPTLNQLSIATELVINEINIIDITGKMIMTAKQNTNVVNVADLSNGIYFIKVITDERTITKKFVKQ